MYLVKVVDIYFAILDRRNYQCLLPLQLLNVLTQVIVPITAHLVGDLPKNTYIRFYHPSFDSSFYANSWLYAHWSVLLC